MDQVIESVERIFKHQFNTFNEHVSELEIFREKVSKKLLVVCKVMGELREMFEELEKTQSEKINSKFKWPDGDNLYETYLKIDTDKVITCV